MPTFEGWILAAPLGFTGGCGELNGLEEVALEETIGAAISASRSGYPLSASASVAKEGAKALMYIIYARNSSTPQPEVTELASVLDSDTTLSRACITSLVAGLESYPAPKSSGTAFSAGSAGEVSGAESGERARRGGTLTGVQWRLGVSLASSSCKALMAPYVALSFSVTDSNGEKKVHTAELSYKEFAELHSSLREVAARMDSL